MSIWLHVRPRARFVYLRLDPQPIASEGGVMFAEQDFIAICQRCGAFMEHLQEPCIPRQITELDAIHDRYILRGIDYSHQTEMERRPTVPEGMVGATIMRSAHPDFFVGERVLISFADGESLPPDDDLSPYRVVCGDGIPARLEE